MLSSWKGRPLLHPVEIVQTVQVVQSFAFGELVQAVEIVQNVKDQVASSQNSGRTDQDSLHLSCRLFKPQNPPQADRSDYFIILRFLVLLFDIQ
jgi:hypothetical protein